MEINVKTLLLKLLTREESNVVTAKERVAQCSAAIEYHKERVQKLRAALEALGVDAENSQSAKGGQ